MSRRNVFLLWMWKISLNFSLTSPLTPSNTFSMNTYFLVRPVTLLLVSFSLLDWLWGDIKKGSFRWCTLRAHTKKSAWTSYLWHLLDRDRTHKLKSFFCVHVLEASGSNGSKSYGPALDRPLPFMVRTNQNNRIFFTSPLTRHTENFWNLP